MSSPEVTGSHDTLSQYPAKSLGAFNGHSVVPASGKSTRLNWVCVALIINGVVGIGFLSLGLANFYVHQNMLPAAFAKTMVGGGILIMIGLAGVVGLVKNNRSTIDPSSLSEVTHKNPSTDIAYIGSPEDRQDETGIRDRLGLLGPVFSTIDTLVIYGTGDVQLNTDPGFVRFNPKKVILVGARIVHEPDMNRLDDKLACKKEWLSSSARIVNVNQTSPTFVTQVDVSSVEEALSDKPPSRGGFKGRYHCVYQVSE